MKASRQILAISALLILFLTSSCSTTETPPRQTPEQLAEKRAAEEAEKKEAAKLAESDERMKKIGGS